MKKTYAFLIALFTAIITVSCTISVVHANSNIDNYKDTLDDLLTKYENIDSSEYKIRLNKNTHTLSVYPDGYGRGDTDSSLDDYFYQAIKAARKTKFNSQVQYFSIRDDFDKYTFNIADVKAFAPTKKDMLNYAEQNNPSDYEDAQKDGTDKHPLLTGTIERDYFDGILAPKAIKHVEIDDDDN